MRIWLKTGPRASGRRPATRTTLKMECLESRCMLDAGYAVTNLISDLPHLASRTDTIAAIALAADANSHPSPSQTEATVSRLNTIARSAREIAIDKVFSAFDSIAGS